MNDTKFYLNNLWLWKCGLPEKVNTHTININELKKSEWSSEFEQLMRNRLVMGAIRYGKLHEDGKPKYNRIDSMIERLKKYSDNGNKEYLVDVANLCLLEYEECHHPKEHFSAIEDENHHVKIVK